MNNSEILITAIISILLTFQIQINPKILWGWTIPLFKKLNPILQNQITNFLGYIYLKSQIYFFNMFPDDSKEKELIFELNESIQKFIKDMNTSEKSGVMTEDEMFYKLNKDKIDLEVSQITKDFKLKNGLFNEKNLNNINSDILKSFENLSEENKIYYLKKYPELKKLINKDE